MILLAAKKPKIDRGKAGSVGSVVLGGGGGVWLTDWVVKHIKKIITLIYSILPKLACAFANLKSSI